MDPTTLVTFLFDCPIAARTVDLLGSWDNFSKPYPLKLDKRRSLRTWSGCYTFDNIICDGDLINLGDKRSGALMMGGTYWYYYKVNNDEEHHNPSQPSTTICPLLPGQRLNVLEIPMESTDRSSSGAFTRNPNDKFLTPVPPNPLPSPRLGDLCREAYKVPMQPMRSPRFATYPSPSRSRSPSFERHARSASTSLDPGATGILSDFRILKEKLAKSTRSASSTRIRSKEWRNGLEIGAPTLVSSTAEDMNLVSLRSARSPKTSSSLVTENLRSFSPLRSNPVDPIRDFDFGFSQASDGEQVLRRRPSSHMGASTTTEPISQNGRARANSSETRRTREYFYPNQPWISSPPLHGITSWEQVNEEDVRTTRIIHGVEALSVHGTSSLHSPAPAPERPTSRHGGTPGLRESPLEKELPALPRYLVPAPLFACNGSVSSMLLENSDEEVDEDDIEIHLPEQRQIKSHFSVWSTVSTTFSMPASEEDAMHSPTFSSLTSNTSEPSSPQKWIEEAGVAEEGESVLKLPSFGPGLFQLDIQYSDAGPRRQAACYGLAGFQGYDLPEVATSQSTITKISSSTEPSINSQHRATSTSQLEQLMSDFGYLGDSVI
ncbi:hypothetical protein BDV96DRAFT_321974 [Lophiotrema nucula]|uniref:Uncharacterized protein n=1 Tax=Lophiotrema nucula TaxID=690887 RepID=A0A6A5ZN03_9PLEO|nr:hypothetical protein BDV96DRAFT_321974 [Lophiotrema nucula]